MIKQQNIKANLAYNIIYNFLIMVLPLVTAPYVSRILGPEGIGVYSYTNSIAHYFVVFSMLGMAKYGNRKIAQVRDSKEELSKTFWSLYALQFTISSISIIIYSIYFFGINQHYQKYFLIQLLQVLSVLFDINWFFFGIEQFKITVTRNAIIKILSTIAIFVFVKKAADLGIYIAITASSFLLSNIVLWTFLFKNIRLVKIDIKEIWFHIKPIFILFIPVIAINLYTSMDKIMITLLSDVVQTGLYENANKITVMPLSIITALGTVMLPRMSNIIARGDDVMIHKYIRDSMQFAMAITIAIMFGLAVIGERFAPLYFGPAFLGSGEIIKLLSPTIVIMAWASVVRSQYLIPKEKDSIYIISVILAAVINMILNFIFIPRYGAIGAVWGTLSAEVIVMLYQSFAIRKELPFKQYISDNFLFMISGGIMYGTVRLASLYLKNGYLELIILILLGMIVYALVSYLVFYLFKRERLLYFQQLILRRAKRNKKKDDEQHG